MDSNSLSDSPAAGPASLAHAVNALLKVGAVRLGAEAETAGVATGFAALDAATGWQGLPRGRLTELIGRPTSGRTSVAMRAAAATPGYTAWIDIPGLVDVDRLARNGVDLERLILLRPEQAADAAAMAVQLVSSGHFTLVVLDSLAELAPGGPTSRTVGQLARVLLSRLGGRPTAMVLLTLPAQHYQSLAHAAALRIAFTPSGLLRRGGVLRGWRSQAHVVKGRGPGEPRVGLELWW